MTSLNSKIDLDNREQVIVVVGASEDKNKWGYKVLMRLRELGFLNTVGVNPKYKEIEGVKCYGTISKFKAQIIKQGDVGGEDVLVVTVVPPAVTEQVVEECGRLGIKKVWMQPGSESEKATRRAKELGIETVSACVVRDGLEEDWGSYGEE